MIECNQLESVINIDGWYASAQFAVDVTEMNHFLRKISSKTSLFVTMEEVCA